MKALRSQHSLWKMLQADNKMLQSDLKHEPLPGAMHRASTLYLLPDLSFTANQSRHLGNILTLQMSNLRWRTSLSLPEDPESEGER